MTNGLEPLVTLFGAGVRHRLEGGDPNSCDSADGFMEASGRLVACDRKRQTQHTWA